MPICTPRWPSRLERVCVVKPSFRGWRRAVVRHHATTRGLRDGLDQPGDPALRLHADLPGELGFGPDAGRAGALHREGLETIAFNLPLNDELEEADTTSSKAGAAWAGYRRDWARWNHLRTASAVIATSCFTAALSVA